MQRCEKTTETIHNRLFAADGHVVKKQAHWRAKEYKQP